MKFVVGAVFALLSACVYAQNDTTTELLLRSSDIPHQELVRLEKECRQISTDLQRRSLHLLNKLQSKDSSILQLRNKLLYPTDLSTIHPLKEYLPGLDSMQTALRFLSAYKLSVFNFQSFQQLNQGIVRLQDQLQQANEIQSFIQSKLQQWQSVPKSFQKHLYYYEVQLQQVKNLLHDPGKSTAKLLSVVRDQPAFGAFFLKNSYLAALFRLPGNSTTASGQPLPGLQTRAQVAAMVEDRLGPGASFASAASGQTTGGNPLAEGLQEAHDQMTDLKEKVSAWGGSSNANMPDFHPNPHHNKTFFQRILLGFDLQTQSSTAFVPALSTVGFSAGYLLNARSIIGVGAAHKLGWGQPFEHIAFSSQGMALRSFVNWRLKDSWWIAGGYEANYYNSFNRLSQLQSISAWQSSALLGLMKIYKAGKRSGNVQLLFDALYKQHIPQSQPVMFRMGYSFH